MSKNFEKPFILCVDDEQVILDSLGSQLSRGYQDQFDVEVANGVEEAWEIIDDLESNGNEIRLIISDWLMTPHLGDQFLEEVYEKNPNIKLALLTGHADERAVERVRKIPNCLGVLRKPWTKEDLFRLVEESEKNNK